MRKLKCKYVDHNPLLLIGPVKEEQLYDKPAIYMYHDIITDQQVELMKHLGTPKVWNHIESIVKPTCLIWHAIIVEAQTGHCEIAHNWRIWSCWLSNKQKWVATWCRTSTFGTSVEAGERCDKTITDNSRRVAGLLAQRLDTIALFKSTVSICLFQDCQLWYWWPVWTSFWLCQSNLNFY